MNYIKKKIKGKKKETTDDDDLDPDLFHVSQAPPGAPKDWIPYDERIDHDSEEWLAFKQLTQRVSTIVEESKQNLTKIVATTALDEQTRTIKEVVVSKPSELNQAVKKKEAPPRPTPPARPPLPSANTTKTSSEIRSSVSICPTHDFDQDKRFEAFGAFEGFEFAKSEPATIEKIDIDEEFGFNSAVDLPIPDLVLDVDNLNLGVDVLPGESDPFDTSFVDKTKDTTAPSDDGTSDNEKAEQSDLNLLTDDAYNVNFLSDDVVKINSLVEEILNTELPEEDPVFCTSEDKILSKLLEDSSENTEFNEEDPFIIKSSVLAAVNMDPFDLFLQNASSASEEPSVGTRSRSPNPFLTEDCDDVMQPNSQLHSSNPFSMSDTDGSGYDYSSAPNPFADFLTSQTAPSSTIASDLFGMDIEEKAPSADLRKLSGDALMGITGISAAIRRQSNPFCQSDGDDVSLQLSNNIFDNDHPTTATMSSHAIPSLFDPFENISNVNKDAFASNAKPTSGWITPPDELVKPTSVIQPTKSFPPPRPAKLPEEKPSLTTAPPPRPPPPSKSAPPARPPPPSVALTKPEPVSRIEDSWDTFSSKIEPEVKHQTECRDLLDDFFGSDIPPVMSSSNGFDILLKEDKVEFEPIAVNINITEATPTPKRNDVSAFFNDVVDTESKDESEFATTKVKDLPRPPSIEFSTSQEDISHAEAGEYQITQEKQAANLIFPDDFTFHTEPTPIAEVVKVETTVTENEPEKRKTLQRIDTSAFEEFEAKFSTILDSDTMSSAYDPFSDLTASAQPDDSSPAVQGFGTSDDFDQFFGSSVIPAAPQPSPAHFDLNSKPDSSLNISKKPVESPDSDDSGPDFSVFIRPKMRDTAQADNSNQSMLVPTLAPPPLAKSPQSRSPTSQPRLNPFDKSGQISNQSNVDEEVDEFLAIFDRPSNAAMAPSEKPANLPVLTSIISPEATSSTIPSAVDNAAEVESLGSPVFEADDTEPLEDFYPKYDGHGWEMMLRQPSKKKLTGQRYWKKIYMTLSDNGVLHLYSKPEDKDAFQELPLQACYSLSELATQQYDQYGKIFTVKLQYIFYRERVGVRPGQINKVAQGQITSLGQLAKLGLPLEHAPQVSQLLKLGSLNYEELKEFVRVVEDALFHLTVHRDRALTYKTEEIQCTVIDELRAEVANNGVVLQQVARVRVFFLAFIGNMPDVEIGLNDIVKQGKEVVGRHDIIPVVTEEWIRLEKCEFHSCVVVDEFEKTRTLKLHPPDACFFELMRFRVRPPKNRELPLQVRTKMTIIGNRVEIRADVIVPGCISRKHGQIPCEDVAIRFPLPECWIYLFRTEKHFRYGSIKSAARRPGKIKGLDRFMGTAATIEPSLIEVSTGQAKYEHQHRAIVWRVPKLPKEGQGAYSTYLFVCRMELSSYDQIPEEFDSTVHVEFSMPTTTASHTTIRSVSVSNPNPPEKYVKYLARHCYRVGIEHVNVTAECEYIAATGNTGSAAASSNGSSNNVKTVTCSREPSEETDASIPSN